MHFGLGLGVALSSSIVRTYRSFSPTQIESVIAYYRNRSDTGFIDSIGSSNRDELEGRCYLFDGSTSYIDTNYVFSPSGDYEVSVWFKTTTSSIELFVDGRDVGNDGFVLFKTAGNTIVGIHNTTTLQTSNLYNDGEWHQAIFSKVGSDLTLSIKNINGVDEETPKTGTDATAINVTATLYVGENNISTNAYEGSLKDLIITEAGTKTLHYKMEEGAGSTAFDSSGNNNHGTITGATLSTFHATDLGTPRLYLNDEGYSKIPYFSASLNETIDTGVTCGDSDFFALIALDSDIVQSDNAGVNILRMIGNEAALAANNGFAISSDTSLTNLSLQISDGISGVESAILPGNYVANNLGKLMVVGISYDYSTKTYSIIGFDSDGTYSVASGVYSGGANLNSTANVVINGISTNRNWSGAYRNFIIAEGVVPTQEDWEAMYANVMAGQIVSAPSGSSVLVNRVGYDDYADTQSDGATVTSGSSSYIYIPKKDGANTDVNGVTLQESGRVKYNLDFVNSNCLTFDGTDDEVAFATPVILSGEFTVHFRASFNLLTSGRVFGDAGSDWIFAFLDANTINLFRGTSGTGKNITLDTTLSTGTWYDFVVARDENNVITLSIDGVIQSNTVTKTESISLLYLGRGSTTYLDGSLCDVQVYDGSTLILNYSLAEGAGSLVFDKSGNDNHGTMTNFTLADAWANTQDVYHHNITDGFGGYTYFSGTNYVQFASSDLRSQTFNIKVVYTAGEQQFFQLSDAAISDRYIAGTINYTKGFTIGLQCWDAATFTVKKSFGSNTASYSEGELLDITFTTDFNGDLSSASVNGVSLDDEGTTSVSRALSTGGQNYFRLGQRGGDQFAYSGYISIFTIDGVLSAGGETWEDTIGSNDGTLQGTFVIGRLPTSGSLDVLGENVSNPAGAWHNDAETGLAYPVKAPALLRVDDLFTTDFWFDSASSYAPNAKSFADIVANYESANIMFADTHIARRKYNLILCSEALTGQNLTNTLNFTNQ